MKIRRHEEESERDAHTHTQTQRDTERQTETDRDRQTETETETERKTKQQSLLSRPTTKKSDEQVGRKAGRHTDYNFSRIRTVDKVSRCG